MAEGYLKLFRAIMNWEWYTDTPCKVLFLHCLFKANYKEGRFRGQIIKPGQFVTSYQKLALEVNLTIQQVRTAIKKLKSTQDITVTPQGQYSIITINNWNEYQGNNTTSNKQSTDNQQTINRRVTTIEEGKKERKKEGKNISFFSENLKNSENQEKTKKTDPYLNPISVKFQAEYEKIFGCKPFLTNNERLKIVELNSDIPDFPATIPIALAKLKDIEFDLPNFNPNANWLLKNDNYTAVLNGTYDKKESEQERFIREMREKLETERMNE